MARVRIETNARKITEEVARDVQNRVTAATAMLHREVVRKVSIPGPPPSEPGEPPHVETGRLRQSIQPAVVREGNVIRGSVGTNVEYAPHLEYGTSKMAARPFLRSTLAEQRDTIVAVIRGTGSKP